jgi:ABC-type cobalamin transport system ATPase subunit
MDELMQQLQQRAGLSQDQAQKATAIFTEFLSNHLSDQEMQSFASKVPGIGQFADKLPKGTAEKLSGMLRGFGEERKP